MIFVVFGVGLVITIIIGLFVPESIGRRLVRLDTTPIRIVFDHRPSAEAAKFIETELPDGTGCGIGEWVPHGEYWALEINVSRKDIHSIYGREL